MKQNKAKSIQDVINAAILGSHNIIRLRNATTMYSKSTLTAQSHALRVRPEQSMMLNEQGLNEPGMTVRDIIENEQVLNDQDVAGAWGAFGGMVVCEFVGTPSAYAINLLTGIPIIIPTVLACAVIGAAIGGAIAIIIGPAKAVPANAQDKRPLSSASILSSSLSVRYDGCGNVIG